MLVNTVDFPNKGIHNETQTITATIPSHAVNTVLHSSINCLTFNIVPILNIIIGTLQLAAAVIPAFSIISAGIAFVTNRIKNKSSVTNTADTFAFVLLAIKSPIANKTNTTLNHNNISLIE